MLAAAFLLVQAVPEVSPAERAAVERFVAACVDGELRGANLREVRVNDLPDVVRREVRVRPAGRYYRFDEQPPSFLIVIPDDRRDSEERMVCSLASPAANPWNLFSGVMNTLQPGRILQRVSNDGPPLSVGMTSEADGYSIQATQAGRYTVIQTIQRTENPGAKSVSPAPIQTR